MSAPSPTLPVQRPLRAEGRRVPIASRVPCGDHHLLNAAACATGTSRPKAGAAGLCVVAAFLASLAGPVLAQTGVAIGIGTPVAHASAALDVQSTTQGLLVPRMTTAQRTGIVAPATGLLVFDTTLGQFQYHAGGQWQAIPGATVWSLQGNSGTDANVHGIGTLDSAPLRFLQNGTTAGRVTAATVVLGKNGLPASNALGNVGLGHNTLTATTAGFQNTAAGNNALSNAPGSGNTGIGNAACSGLTGDQNTGVGANTLTNAATGNAALGHGAGASQSGAINSVFIGRDANSTIGGITNSIAIGFNRAVTANNQVRIGNTSITSIGGQVGWSTLSDARTKTRVKADVHGLDFILKLRPVTYTYDAHRTAALLGEDLHDSGDGRGPQPVEPDAATRQGREEQSRITYTGFIAQEVEAAAREVGFDFSGVDAPKHADDLYGLRYAEFTVPLVKAVQEQQAMIAAQQAIIDDLMRRIQALEQR